MMWSLLLAFTAIALPAYAQTQAQIQACGNSIVMTSYPESGTYTYDTSDTAFFSATYTYSVEACTNNNVPLNRLFLTDYYEGSLYQCSLSRFDQTGMLTSTCNLARSMTQYVHLMTGSTRAQVNAFLLAEADIAAAPWPSSPSVTATTTGALPSISASVPHSSMSRTPLSCRAPVRSPAPVSTRVVTGKPSSAVISNAQSVKPCVPPVSKVASSA